MVPSEPSPEAPAVDALDLPVGKPLPDWRPAMRPPRTVMAGRTCRIEPLAADVHGPDLFAAFNADRAGRVWTYLAYGPFATLADFTAWLADRAASQDPLFFAIVDITSGRALGMASYLRIEPAVGVVEVGNINYAPALQRTTAATEAMFLMMRHAFAELGYRRYEWKCDSLNAGSRRAALRLGFTYEGVFRQATVTKGRNRDTAWYSILDHEWPACERAFVAWLDDLDAQGRQRRSLADLIARERAP